MTSNHFTKTTLSAAIVLALSACGGSSGGDDEPLDATFSLGVSDNPANAEIVNVAFKQVVLKGADGSISFDVSDNGELKHINLLDVQGSDIESLVNAETIPVGEYQLCIYMDNDTSDSAGSSYVRETDMTTKGLVTNSNGSCGGEKADDPNTGRLFFNQPFVVAAGANNFVAEFDLMKGLQGPHGNKDYWTLKPTSVQLVNTVEVGAIAGEVPQSVLTQCEARVNELGEFELSPSVYLYSGAAYHLQDDTDLTKAVMVDFRPTDEVSDGEAGVSAPQIAPIAAARVNQDEATGNFGYEFGFVATGDYSVGYTCVSQNDDVEASNDESSVDGEGDSATPAPFLIDASIQQISVNANETSLANFAEQTE